MAKRPTFSIYLGGSAGAFEDITGRLQGGGLDMTVTDGIGLKADNLQITIDDKEGRVRVPRTGVILSPRGGYIGGTIRNFGLFVVDNVNLTGYPQKISISAQSMDAKSSAKRREPADYRKEEFPTYGDVFRDAAKKAGLTLSISGELASIPNEYEAKGEEEFVEFATRLGMKLDASLTIKSGRMIVVPRGRGISASGLSMPVIMIRRGFNLLSYNWSSQDAPKHSEVEATWYDRSANERKIETAPAGSDGPKYMLREPYQSASEAKLAARSTGNRLRRAEKSADFTIEGDPTASAGAMAVCQGARAEVDGTWSSKTVTHEFSGSSTYTNNIQCELPT